MEPHSPPDSGSSGSARLRVLEMIDEGTITAEEGMRLLQAFSIADETAEAADKLDFLADSGEDPAGEAEIPLPGGAPAAAPPTIDQTAGFAATTPGSTSPSANNPAVDQSAGEPPAAALPEAVPISVARTTSEPPGSTASGALPADALKWKRWWMVPVWIGVAITVFGGLFMYLAMRSSGIGLWFVCASTPFILGILLIVLAWGSRNAPWLHLRVQQPPGEKPEKIAFSLPLPIRPAAWFLRTFSRWIPSLKEQSLDELILAVGDKTGPDNPLYVVVDEQETGEKVEIYIG